MVTVEVINSLTKLMIISQFVAFNFYFNSPYKACLKMT